MAGIISALAATELESRLSTQNILVVGGTAGIGKALSEACLKRGARVTVVGRRSPGPELASATFVAKDLSLMENAAALAKEIGDANSYDTILFTNGIFAASERQVSGEGIELDLAVSYLSRYVFMQKLLDNGYGASAKKRASKQRVFVMGFPGAKVTPNLDDFNWEQSYSAIPVHMNTVAANEALVTHINLESHGNVNAYGLSPGIIKTEIRDNFLGKGSWKSSLLETMIGWFTPTAESYAEKQLIHILTSPELEGKPGLMINNKRQIVPPNPALTPEVIERIMTESQKLTNRALSSKVPL